MRASSINKIQQLQIATIETLLLSKVTTIIITTDTLMLQTIEFEKESGKRKANQNKNSIEIWFLHAFL